MSILRDISRLEVDAMDDLELDAGMAMAIGLPTRIEYIGGERLASVLRDGEWKVFRPTGSWDDFGYAFSLLGGGMVMSVHRDYETNAVRYYSAHAFLSGTQFYSKADMRVAVAKAAVAYAKLDEWKAYKALGL